MTEFRAEIAEIRARCDALRDKIGDTASELHARIEAERVLLLAEVDRRTAGDPWWLSWAKFALWGTTSLLLAGGIGLLVYWGLLPEGSWDRLWGLAEDQL